MADLSYTVDVNTSQAQKNLDALNKKVDQVNKTFASFKQALVGFALGGFVSSAFQMADAIQDLSDALNISTDAILGFSTAVAQSGGDSDKAQQGLLKFVNTIGEAADGSLKAQNAFNDVGISLQDLRTLSEQDLLSKAVDGLSKIDDAGKRSVLQMELFGKALRGVSASGVQGLFAGATADSAKYASAIKAAADTQQNFETVIKTLKVELLASLKPISEVAAGLLDMGKATKSFISTVLDIAVVIGSFFAIGKVIQLVLNGFKLLIAAPMLVKSGIDILVKTWEVFKFQLGKVAAAGEVTGTTITALGKRLDWLGRGFNEIMKGLGILGAAFVAFYKTIVPEGAQEKIGAFFDWLKEKVSSSGPDQGRGNAALHLEMYQKQTEELKRQADAAREVQDALAKRRKEIEQSSVAFKKQNAETIDAINLEKQLVGKSEDYAEVTRAQEAIYKKAADEADKLRTAKNALTKDEQGLAPIYDQQIQKIKEQADVDAERVKRAIEGLQGLKLLEQDRVNQIERINQALQKQATYDQSILDIRRQAQDALNQAKFEGEQIGRTPLEQKIEEIKYNAQKAAQEAGRAFSQQFEGLELTAEDSKRLSDGLDLIAQKYKDIAEQQTKNLQSSRTFATGWKTAFDEYMDNATNASKRAGDAFRSVTSNMESAIDKFVETGKFSFKDFANSVIQDLIKIELKAQATQLLKGAMSAGGSFLSSLFGFAEGGQPPVGKPSIVGEKGPELFVPRTAGTIIPNNQLGSGGGQQTINNNYVYNVSAIDAKSVAEFFAANRKTMLGTIQLAQKEMPYGNR